jgi:hypothetical protein
MCWTVPAAIGVPGVLASLEGVRAGPVPPRGDRAPTGVVEPDGGWERVAVLPPLLVAGVAAGARKDARTSPAAAAAVCGDAVASPCCASTAAVLPASPAPVLPDTEVLLLP